jgi:DNA invertase Pin-like site-specific DNA recombinase
MLDDPTDPQRKLIRTIVGAVNDCNRSMVVTRMQAGRRLKKAAGGYAGGQPPYGYRGGVSTKELAPDPHEQQVLARMRDLAGARHSTRTIAKTINDEGLRTRRRGAWSSPMVSKYVRVRPWPGPKN